jgi:hypothetical protein
MRGHLLFCRACDREVRVLITGTPLYEDQAPVRDEGLVCLEIGDDCNGNLCPLGASAPDAMVGRLIRNGVPLDSLTTVAAECPACGNEAEMVLYGNGRAAYALCGTAARWAYDHVEPAD